MIWFNDTFGWSVSSSARLLMNTTLEIKSHLFSSLRTSFPVAPVPPINNAVKWVPLLAMSLFLLYISIGNQCENSLLSLLHRLETIRNHLIAAVVFTWLISERLEFTLIKETSTYDFASVTKSWYSYTSSILYVYTWLTYFDPAWAGGRVDDFALVLREICK